MFGRIGREVGHHALHPRRLSQTPQRLVGRAVDEFRSRAHVYVECSAETQCNLHKVFQEAMKAVLHPRAPSNIGAGWFIPRR
jgi:hypothetical protein